MKTEEIAYLAGFFDGEGTISIVHRKEISGWNGKKYNNWRLKIGVGNHCGKPLFKFEKLLGGSVSKGKSKTCCKYYWSADGNIAASALIALLPCLSVKKKQALVAIKFQQRIKSTPKAKAGLSKRERWMRNEMRLEIRRLNARYSLAAKNRLIKEGVSCEYIDNQKPWDENSRIGRRDESPSCN